MNGKHVWKINIPGDGNEYGGFESVFESDWPGDADSHFRRVAEEYAEHLSNFCDYLPGDFDGGLLMKVVSPQGLEKSIRVEVECAPSFYGRGAD